MSRPRPSETLRSILRPPAVAACCCLVHVPGRARKQEMLAIAGLLCTLWEIMGGVRGGGDVPLARVPHQHISTTSSLSGQEAALPVIALITL